MINIETVIKNNASRYAENLGIGVMTLATVVGMLELPDHTSAANRFVLPSQVVKVEANDLNELNNPIRRENEEATIQHISYSQTQRTPSRSRRY